MTWRLGRQCTRHWLKPPAAFVAALVMVLTANCAAAQGTAAAEKAGADKANANPTPPIPDNFKLNLLIRTTIVALNQANQSGNYSVLRDLASPEFQNANDDAALAISFAELRGRKLDLSPVLFYDPKLVNAPAVQSNGILRLTGFFETAPERVIFDLGFQFVRDQWRLAAIIVEMKPATSSGAERVLTPPPTTGNSPAPRIAQ